MFQKKLVILSVVSFIMLISLVVASMIFTNRLNNYNHFFIAEVEPRNNSLNAILTSFGYGHGIHNFKNLLLRGEDTQLRQRYYDKLQFNKRQFYFALYNYVALVNQNTLAKHQFSQNAQSLIHEERNALKQIKFVFDEYIKNADEMFKLYQTADTAANRDIRLMDTHITIDDTPALLGMKALQAGIDQLRAEVLSNSRQLVETLNILIILSALLLAVFICTAITFGFQLLRPIINFRKLLNKTESTSAAIRQFRYPHQDEIGSLFDDIERYSEDKEVT